MFYVKTKRKTNIDVTKQRVGESKCTQKTLWWENNGCTLFFRLCRPLYLNLFFAGTVPLKRFL